MPHQHVGGHNLEVPSLEFKSRATIPDGWCFWHSLIRANNMAKRYNVQVNDTYKMTHVSQDDDQITLLQFSTDALESWDKKFDETNPVPITHPYFEGAFTGADTREAEAETLFNASKTYFAGVGNESSINRFFHPEQTPGRNDFSAVIALYHLCSLDRISRTVNIFKKVLRSTPPSHSIVTEKWEWQWSMTMIMHPDPGNDPQFQLFYGAAEFAASTCVSASHIVLNIERMHPEEYEHFQVMEPNYDACAQKMSLFGFSKEFALTNLFV